MPTPREADAGVTLKIIVVEDHADTRQAMGEMLRRWGHSVRLATSGEEALVLLAEESADLVLTDLLLPGLDGWELAERARTLEYPPAVAMVTGWMVDVDEVRARERGVDAVIEKPASPQEIRSLLARYRSPS